MHSIIQSITESAGTVFDLTTVEAVNAMLGLTSDTGNDTEVATEITAASQIIAAYCNRVFAQETVIETFRIRSYGEHWHSLPLSRYPVSDIGSVYVDDVLLSDIYYECESNSGLLYKIGGCWSGKVVVTYMGGYSLPDDAPAALARACLEYIKTQRANAKRNLAVRDVWHNQSRVAYFSGGELGAGIPTHITDLLAQYKRPAL